MQNKIFFNYGEKLLSLIWNVKVELKKSKNKV